MADKQAVVFDTNFVIENKNRLPEVIKNLKTRFNVYIPQVSVEERVAQKQRSAKVSFDEINECAKKNRSIAHITITTTFDDECQRIKESTTKTYSTLVNNNVIPYNKEEITFEIILERAYKKIPPFPLNEKSDNGFKDTVLWLSIINYFKNHGEDEIILISEDKAFGKNQDILANEFKQVTNKNIRIVPNSYYNDLFNSEEQKTTANLFEQLLDVSQLRIRISETILDLCGCPIDDGWGNEYWQRYFEINSPSNSTYARTVLDALPKIINTNIFEQSVSAFEIFDFDGRVELGATPIPIDALEAAHRLHQEIKEKYPAYLEQFYLTVSNVLNNNFNNSQEEVLDVELPF